MTDTPRTVEDFKDAHSVQRRIEKLEAELRRATRESADVAAIKEVIGSLGAAVSEADPPTWMRAPIRTPSSPGVPTLFLSDFHWGEVVQPAQIGGVNEFNLAIARRRLRYCVETAEHLCRILSPEMDYPGIVVPLGGDMISGNIHEELTATNELNSMPTVLDLFDHLSGAIRYLADVFGHVHLPCVSGNHGRDTRKIWSKDRHHTSFDWLLYQFLARHFAQDSRIKFYIPDSSDARYQIFDLRYLLTHGDQFRAGDSIIGPIGPIFRGNQKKRARQQQVGQDYDVLINGHWHKYMHTAENITNGALKGYDEYAFFQNYSFEPPQQALWLTHPRYGITYRMPVIVEQPSAPKSRKWYQRAE
jgi:hypothetical protein